MVQRIFERPVDLAQNTCRNLYRDAVSADVHFVFNANTDDPVEVHAHKNILSTNSSVFHTMFYGSIKEGNVIRIVDASSEAFEEFLQFFYLNNVRLTSNHIIEVAYLCKKYEVSNGLKVCEIPLQNSLIDDITNICSNYKAVLLLEMKNVETTIETIIVNNAQRVLKTPDYLDCDSAILKRILQLLSTRCNASEIVDACMKWANAKCKRNNLPQTTTNFRAQLNGLIDLIPFDGLSAEQFSHYAVSGFFQFNDLQAIVLKTLSKKRDHPELSSANALDCNRVRENSVEMFTQIRSPFKSAFKTHIPQRNSSNAALLLTEFYITETALSWDLTCLVIVSRGNVPIISERVTLVSGITTHVILSRPVLINSDISYGIQLDTPLETIYFKRKLYRNVVNMKDGIKVNFPMPFSMVTRLKFQQPVA